MNRQKIQSSLLVYLTCFSALAASDSAEPWGYSGHQGPEHWGELAPEFARCSSGKNQSPIDISQTTKGDLAKLEANYEVAGEKILNNGHSIQVNYAPGSYVSLAGQQFELKQFHFHSPSENTVKGQSFPLEAHFVHADAQGQLAVVALMFTQGEANKELAKAWAQLPLEAGDKATLTAPVSAAALWPANQDYYRFNGSLTTPPCSEGVTWLVLKTPVSASKQQIVDFTAVMGHNNNRPVQPLNARLIVE
ncbi:carbonic anhydrase [Agarivorans sp. MS3-6]|uniref:carbonic anhydrase n=1 Tax=Agarivorans sp. TSD2052 TaxID=2937286 RepID=UPI00200FA6FC|nr:carbonic anhydrase family protein [Agarivorans sp. TSD2052]UPW19624.1 carbonic anhydrase family protein [Agarivorans sp. TSD2052]